MCARHSYDQWVSSCGMIYLPIFREKNAELFQGKIDNTDVGKILKAVVVKK